MPKKLFILIALFACTNTELLAMENLDNQLIHAVYHNRHHEVQALLLLNANVNAREENAGNEVALGQTTGATPLIIAVNHGNEGLVKLLLSHGAGVNLQDMVYGYAALDRAAWKDQIGICKLLLDAGADVSMQDDANKSTALWAPARLGNTQLLNILLTTIPLSERKNIQEKITGLTALAHTQPPLLRELRQIITQDLINSLVQDQMLRIQRLIMQKDEFPGKTVREWAAEYHPTIAQLLDLNNPESYAKMHKLIKNNVCRILFGKSIQEKQKEQTHYALLGIGKDASPYEIEAAYRNLYLQMQEAFKVLSDPATRTAYDQALSKK